MAKNIQEAEVIITVSGKAATDSLKNLTEKQREYERAVLDGKNAEVELDKLRKTAIKDLQLEGKTYSEVEAAIKARIKAGQEAQKNLNQVKKDIQINKVETKKFADILKDINGATLKELEGAAKQLKNEIRRLTPGTQEFVEKSKQLKDVNTRIVQLRTSFKGVVDEQKKATFSIRGFVDGFNKYWGLLTMAAGAVTGISMSFRKAAQAAAELDDTYADVMKTTGLLHEQVADLDKELMKIDTRTSREQLLLLARDAGKLGIQGKENILGFVRAADQIQVALGEDLGEGAIKNLGKIADVFGLTKEMGIEKSLLSIASAVNALGQASTASEAYLVDFTQRLAGVGAMAGLSVQDILGFASGLDQSAMKVEMAATAFQKFLMKMYEEPAKFAQYAGMEVEAFTELLKTNANEAITIVMKAMNGQDGFAAMVPVFNEMGLDGARAVGVLSAMTKNLDAVTEAQALANVEFEKATSVTEEYRTKNNNLQAQLEKARKEFHNASVALGQSLNPIMLKSTKATTYLIKVLASYGKEIGTAVIAVAALTLAIKRQATVQTALNVVQKLSNTLRATGNTLIWAARTAFFRLIGATAAATIAQQQLNAVMSASVFGVIALAVGGLTAAITHLVKKQREAGETTDYLAEAEKRANEEYSEQAGKVKALTSIVENNNIALGERKKALEELKSIVPGYHGDLTEEGRLINANKEAIDEYCKSLRQQIRLQARQDQLLEIEKQIAALEDQKADAQERQHQTLVDSGGDTTEKDWGKHSWFTGKLEYTPYGQAKADEAAADKQIADLTAQAEKVADGIGKIFTDPIEKIKAEYEAMFEQIRKESLDDPKAGEVEIRRLQEERDRKISEIRKTNAEVTKVETEGIAQSNTILTQTQFEYLQERQDKLTKKEKEMVAKGYAALSVEESKALKARYGKLMNADQKLGDQRYQAQVKQLEQEQRAEQNLINKQFFDNAITAEEHEKALRDITMKYLLEKRKLAENNGKDVTQIDAAIYSERMKTRKEDYDEALKQLKAQQREEELALMERLADDTTTQKEYEEQLTELKYDYILKRMQLAEQSGQDETAVMQEWLDMQADAVKEAAEKMEKLRKEAQDVRDSLRTPSQIRDDEMKTELDRLEELHKAMLLSDEDYGKASEAVLKKYAEEGLKEKLAAVEKYASKVNSIMSTASDFVTALREAESAKLEAQYQADLTAAGDNAEKREQVEADYERKQLELQKKYADVDMAIKIAKTTAAGAVAAVRAWEEGGPYAGPALAALVAATTAAEVATIVAQRNAIKNQSISGSSGSSSTGGGAATGERTVTGEGWDEGGYTGPGTMSVNDRPARPKKRHSGWRAGDDRIAGVVHANEWVAPAWMVRQFPVVFANLERYRKTGNGGTMSVNERDARRRGYADGGPTDGLGTMSVNDRPAREGLKQLIMEAIEETMRSGAMRAYVVRNDIKELDEQDARLKKQTSR